MLTYQHAIFLAAVVSVTAGTGRKQSAVLYDQFNTSGSSIFIPSTYKSDLKTDKFDNRAHSACVTGVWIFYEDPDFNPTGKGKAEYIYGDDNFCANFKVVRGSVSSVRYAGHPNDHSVDTFTIYQHSFFQGKEEYAFSQLDDLEILKGNHQSIIITGCSDWTVFDRPNFQGNSICLKVPTNESGKPIPSFIDDLQDRMEGRIPHGSIQSARKGCTSGNNIEMSSFGVFN